MATKIPEYELNDGTTLPAIGFGTYPLTGEEGVESFLGALETGYRLLDSAVNYGNEAEVGEAVRRSSVPREQVWARVRSQADRQTRLAAADLVVDNSGSLQDLRDRVSDLWTELRSRL